MFDSRRRRGEFGNALSRMHSSGSFSGSAIVVETLQRTAKAFFVCVCCLFRLWSLCALSFVFHSAFFPKHCANNWGSCLFLYIWVSGSWKVPPFIQGTIPGARWCPLVPMPLPLPAAAPVPGCRGWPPFIRCPSGAR